MHLNKDDLLHAKLNFIINALIIMPQFINAAAAGANKEWKKAGKEFETRFNDLSQFIEKYEKQNAENNSDTTSVEGKIS